MIKEPFTYGFVDDYLDEDMYERLLSAFPDQTVYVNYSEKPEVGSRCDDLRRVVARMPEWRELLEFFGSERFVSDLRNHIVGLDSVDRPERIKQIWDPATTRRGDGLPVRTTFKFSSMRRGDWIQPHTDNPRKIVSLLLYFADQDWLEAYGGGTEIYQPRHPIMNRNWHNVDAPFGWMKRKHVISFIPNRLYFFVKSANSWHGVAPIACPEGRRRKTLLMTIQHSEHVETVWQRKFYGFIKSKAVRAISRRMREYYSGQSRIGSMSVVQRSLFQC